MKIQAIIPAAGCGVRLKSDTPKPLVEIDGKAIILHALKAFEDCAHVESIIVAAPPDSIDQFQTVISGANFKKRITVIAGGSTRKESVGNALNELDADTGIVAVHDAARALILPDTIDRAVALCEEKKAVIVAVPAVSTIKRIDPHTKAVIETLKRDELWEVQTPQVFDKDLLIKAHGQKGLTDATDDAMLVEHLGEKVFILKGDYTNIKITTNDDLIKAEAILKKTTRS